MYVLRVLVEGCLHKPIIVRAHPNCALVYVIYTVGSPLVLPTSSVELFFLSCGLVVHCQAEGGKRSARGLVPAERISHAQTSKIQCMPSGTSSSVGVLISKLARGYGYGITPFIGCTGPGSLDCSGQPPL